MKLNLMKLKPKTNKPLTASEIVILNYINNNFTSIPFVKIENLALITNTSTSTIVRFSKKLGYKGFDDLRHAVIKKLNTNDKGSENTVIVKSFIEALKQLEIANDIKTYKKIAKLITKNNKLLIFGQGTNKLVADLAVKRLISQGYNALSEYGGHLAYEIFKNFSKGDVVIIMSYSGKTHSVLKRLSKIPKGVKTVSITWANSNALAKKTDYNLKVPIVLEDFKHVAKISKLTRIALLDILIDLILEK